MLKIFKKGNSLIVEGTNNGTYVQNGLNSYPLNSLIVQTDESGMATFRSAATNDVLFSGVIKDMTIDGAPASKETLIQTFDTISNTTTGGGGGTAVDAYTKAESDALYPTKQELNDVKTIAQDADTKADAVTSRIEDIETAQDDKQDLLVSGVNIKTINNESVLGTGNINVITEHQSLANYPTKEEVNTELAKKSNSSDVYTKGEIDAKGYLTEHQSLADYYTKTQSDEKFQVKGNYLTEHQDISGLATKQELTDGLASKQDTLVSGTSIKTINGKTLLGEGDIVIESSAPVDAYTKTESDAKYQVKGNYASQAEMDDAAADISALEADMMGKQATLVSGTNIKTVNGNSLLGAGDIVIEGGSGSSVKTHTITLTGNQRLGDKYNSRGYGSLFLTVETEQYDIDAIETGDIINFNTGETGIAQKDKNGNKFVIVRSYSSDYETREIQFKSNTSLWCFSILPISYVNIGDDNFRIYGVTANQMSIWNSTATIKNYYDYLIGSQNFPYASIVEPPTNFKGLAYRNTDKGKIEATTLDYNSMFVMGSSYDEAIEYTIGKGTQSGLLMYSPGYQPLNITADGSWEIPSVYEYEDQGWWTNSEIYVNGSLAKSMGISDGMTWKVGDKIRIVNSNFFGSPLFQMWQNINTDFKINVSYVDVYSTDATNQMINVYNGNKYLLRTEANEWVGTQAEYDALTTKQPHIIYYITE